MLCYLLLVGLAAGLEFHAGHEAQHSIQLTRRDQSHQKRRKHGVRMQVEISPTATPVPVALTTPLEDMSSEYTGVIGVGTNKEGKAQFEARVVFDTGSTNLWVASVLCKEYPCKAEDQDRFYDPDKSSSQETYTGGRTKDIDIMFGTGELKGPLHVDTYRVGPMAVEQQPFAMIREMSGDVFSSFAFEGILGLAFPSLSFGGIEPFFERVIRNKLLKKNEFAFYLNTDSTQPSALLWGGVDKDLFEGDIVMFPVVKPHYWALELIDFRIGDKSLLQDEDHPKSRYLIIDSGTTYFTAPSGVYDEVMEHFPQAACGEVENYQPLTYVLKSQNDETYRLQVTQETYMVGDERNSCRPAFMKLDIKKQYGPAMILGEVFMRHFFTVFSRGNGELDQAKVGFARAKMGAKPKINGKTSSASVFEEDLKAPLVRKEAVNSSIVRES